MVRHCDCGLTGCVRAHRLVTSDDTNRNPVKDEPERLLLLRNKLKTIVENVFKWMPFFCIFVHSLVLVLFPESCRPRSEPMSFFQGIKLVMGHGPYAKLVMVFLFTSLAFMVRIETHTHNVTVGLVSVCTVSKSQLTLCVCPLFIFS